MPRRATGRERVLNQLLVSNYWRHLCYQLDRLVLFIYFHYMSIVRVHPRHSRALLSEYENTASRVRDSIGDLSRLVTEAHALLELPGQNPVHGPIPALQDVINGLGEDHRDFAWRLELIEASDSRDMGEYKVLDINSLNSMIDDGDVDLIEALMATGLTEEQARQAKSAINQGASFQDAVNEAGALDRIMDEFGLTEAEAERFLKGVELTNLNEAIDNWAGTDNDPMLDRLIAQRNDLIKELGDFGYGVDEDVLALAAMNNLSYEEALSVVEGAKLAELNEAINNWTGSDNDPIFDQMVRDRNEFIQNLTGSEEYWKYDPEIAALAASNGISYEEAQFGISANTIDSLAAGIDGWTGHPNDARFIEMQVELSDEIARLAQGDPELARLINVAVQRGLPTNEALFAGVLQANSETPISELLLQLEDRVDDPDVFDPVAMALQAAVLQNIENFTGADADDVDFNVVLMAQDNGLTYNAAVALVRMEIEAGNLEWPGVELPEYLDEPIGSGEEAAFRLLQNREVFDEIEHANGGWRGPDAKMSAQDWQKVLDSPGEFSDEAVALATFFSENPDEWLRFDTARDGVALSGLASGDYGVGEGDGTTSWVDIEQYVTNSQLFNALSTEMARSDDFLADLDGDGHLDEAEFQAALAALEESNENYEGLRDALQFAIDTDLMDLPDDRSIIETIGDGVYTISSLVPGSPMFNYRMATDPTGLFQDQLSLAEGAWNATVALGEFVHDVNSLNPGNPAFWLELQQSGGNLDEHGGVQLLKSIPVLAESALSLNPMSPQFYEQLEEVRTTGTWDSHDGLNLVTATLDWETFAENPAEWVGQFAPDVLISIATGGGGSITRAATTMSRATRAAQTFAANARRIGVRAATTNAVRWGAYRISPRLAQRIGVNIEPPRVPDLPPPVRPPVQVSAIEDLVPSERIAAAIDADLLSPDEFVAAYGRNFPSDDLAAAGYREYLNAGLADEAPVLGRLDDTKAAQELGLPILDSTPWSPEVNDAYIQGIIDANQPVYLATNPGPNAFNASPLSAHGPHTVFHREYMQLLEAGYVKRGDYLVPPGSPVNSHLPIDVDVDTLRQANFDHALDGELTKRWNDKTREYDTVGTGGHYPRSENIRILERSAPDANGVTSGKIAVWDSATNSWAPKNAKTHTFFPDRWSKRETQFKIEEAFDNSTQVSRREWVGTTSDGVTITGYYVTDGVLGHGWTSAFPIYNP